MPLDSYVVRLSLAEGSEPLAGPLAPLLELLRHPPTPENPVPCVALSIHDSQLFNAVDEVANLFLQQGILTGIVTRQKAGQRGLFVPVPVDSTIGIIRGKMEELAASVGADVQMRVENFANLASNASEVFDMLLRTVLKFQFQSNDCLQFERRNEAPQVLMISEPRSGDVPTIAILNVLLVADSTGRPVIELECMPKMMRLVTLAEPIGPRQYAPSSGSVMVLPRLGKGWLVSRFGNTPATGVERAGKARLAGDVKPNTFVQPVSSTKGFHRYAPKTDEEFRRYWLGVHRIRLPEDFGGYAHVTFAGRLGLKLTYPACCVAYQWTILPRETRAQSAEVIEQFQFLLQQMVGKKAITVSRATELPSTTNALPAIGLISQEILSHPALDTKTAMKSEPTQNQLKRQLQEDVKEQKVKVDAKKQRKNQRAKAPRVKSQRAKRQGVKSEQMK